MVVILTRPEEVEVVESPPASPKHPELLRAAEVVRRGWCQDSYCEPDNGLLDDEEKMYFCGAGALFVAFGWRPSETLMVDGYDESVTKLMPVLGFESVDELVKWNDAEGRTKEQVAERFERAAYEI